MLEYRVGDCLNSNEEIVVHGCNCWCVMGAGIAAQIRKQCPNAHTADKTTIAGDMSKMGTYSYGIEANGMIVVNAYTQYGYNRTKVNVDYLALEKAIRSICSQFANRVIAMPKIGCGLGGGDWNIVSEILERISNETNKTIRVYTIPQGR